ncbi:MazG-like nucleotide pyrophosphohydrolase [Microbacterium phage Honk]|uniref:MazG-like nucleotide pyrophosphohydrolase n=1 Tax=Microbacterium phage Honk TaxID=2836095 RepID=A0A8F3EBK3_9CAUD|nr:MazG-like nucleotide pyrophosphohydrolase [Microbacterium phage Honk]
MTARKPKPGTLAAASDAVREFHAACGIHFPATPALLSEDEVDLNFDLIFEELNEYSDAADAGDIVGVADAITDILVVTIRAGLAHGLDLSPLFDEVHRSNMTKLLPDGTALKRDDGKVLKGPNYEPPALEELVRAQEVLIP